MVGPCLGGAPAGWHERNEHLKMHLVKRHGRRIFNWTSPVSLHSFPAYALHHTVRKAFLRRDAPVLGDHRAASPALLSLKQAVAPPFSRSACVGTQLLLHAGNYVKAQALLLAVSFR